jgi:putative ABC transport system permease protein
MSFIRRLFNLGRSEELSHDINRELSFHMREYVEELTGKGMSEADAIAAARQRFGNPTYLGEQTRDADIIGWLDSFLGDVRYGLRALRRSPVFTAVAIISLALGIGANTAIYTLMDVLILRPLPVPQAEQLIRVATSDSDDGGYFTNPMWEQVRDRQQGLSSIAAFSETSFNIADGGEVRRILGMWASGDFFNLFGMQPSLGRLFTKADDVRGCPGIGVLGHGFWQSEFGGRRDVLGKTISITGRPIQIIGVTSPGFASPEIGRDVHLYVPICAEAYVRATAPIVNAAGPVPGSSLDNRSNWWLRVIGRRSPDVTLAQSTAMLKAIAPAVYGATVPPNWAAADKLDYEKRTFSAVPAESGMSEVRDRYGKALTVLMGAVALVLLIACANVANLLIARAAARQREVAIRMAIGAGRRRLVRQLLTESGMLALLGAAGGLAVAQWATRALVALISTDRTPVALDLAMNWRVLGFTALIASVTAILFGLVPAWRGTRISPQTAMKATGRGVAEGGGSHGRFNLGKTLVATQIALSLTLLVGAGLLIESLRKLRDLDPGFSTEGVLVATTGFQRTGIPAAQIRAVQRQVLERVRATPGVRAASTADLTPVGQSSWNDGIWVDGAPEMTMQQRVVWFNEISDGYFETLQTKLIAGRDFGAADVPGAPKAAIINQEAAKKFFGDASPLGKQFRTKHGDKFSDPYTIVGVVESAKYQNLREKSSATAYIPVFQSPDSPMGVQMVIRTDGNPLAMVPAVKRIMADVHRLSSVEFRTLKGQLEASMRREQLLAWLSGLFGAVALALSMLGLYGVMAYTVARRRNEIGVRIALGADNGRVLRMVLGDVARVVVVGIAIGAGGALATGKLVTSFLYGLTPTDPVVLGVAGFTLLAVALLAGLIPALKASRVDPVAALRED